MDFSHCLKLRYFLQFLQWRDNYGGGLEVPVIMKIKICKNRRYQFPYFNLSMPVLIRKNKSFSISKQFLFTDSSIYGFNDGSRSDINKLFGFSIGHHHTDSFRFGWRPNIDLSKIEIVSYEYLNGIRVKETFVCDVKLNEWYQFKLKYCSVIEYIQYTVTDNNDIRTTIMHPIELKNNKKWGYRLGFWW